VAESEGHKEEMLKLIMEQNAQIKEMEAELDKMVKEKEQNMQMVVIPLEAVPLTGISTTTAVTTEFPSAIPMKVPNASNKLVKSMEDMSVQGEEIGKLREEVKSLQDLKSMFQSSYNTKINKSQRLSQEIQKLQNETIMAKTLSEAKENIWMDINNSMAEIWPFIQMIFEQHALVQTARTTIEKIREDLGERPTEATEFIRFLNSKTKQELEA
jgi:DNA repair ATPase RecN